MSCFLCSDLHTAVCAIITHNLGVTHLQPATLARRYREINNASLACRYGDAPQKLRPWAQLETAAREWIAQTRPADHRRVLECLEYQCDEGGTMRTHEHAHLLTKAIVAATDRARGTSSTVWSI